MQIPVNLNDKVKEAVKFFWTTRIKQAEQQATSGKTDQGARSAVTGGKQMDGFVDLLKYLVKLNGINDSEIFANKKLELPGFFRPTKQWDLLIVSGNDLIAALEFKSQIGPSFGNNFNNRTEEAMGSSLDIWTAFRKGGFGSSPQPWLGYLMLLEDCPKSQLPVAVEEPHFKVFEEFKNASYAKRYELFCRKLVLERHYNCSCFIMSDKEKGLEGEFSQPAEDLMFERFAASLLGHVSAFTMTRK